MAASTQIPYYASDGKPLGYRPLETAQRLVANGFAKPSYGRKGHLKAIWLRREDGTSPVQPSIRAGTRYSFLETLEHGRCWERPLAVFRCYLLSLVVHVANLPLH